MINYKLLSSLSESEIKLVYIVESYNAPLKTTLSILARDLHSHAEHIMKTLKNLHLKNIIDYNPKKGRNGYIILTIKERLNGINCI